MTLTDFFTPDSYIEFVSRLPDATGEIITENVFPFEKPGEYYQLCKDGSVILTEVVAKILADENGLPSELLGVSRNIAERKFQEELIRSQRNMALFLSSSSNMKEALNYVIEMVCKTGIVECGGIYLLNNSRHKAELSAFYGLSDEFVKKAFHLEIDSSFFRRIKLGQPTYSNSLPIAKTTYEFHVREGLKTLALIPVLYENEPIALLSLASRSEKDITHDKRAYLESLGAQLGGTIARIRAEEELVLKDFALGSSINAIYLADLNGRLFFVNKAFKNMLGYDTTDEVLGRHISEFASSRQKVENALKSIISGHGFQGDQLALKKDGKMINIHISASLVRSPGSDPLCIMASFIDITRQKHMEQMMNNAIISSEEKQRAIFAADLHDGLGPMLSSLKMFLKTMEYINNQDEKNKVVLKINEVIDESIVILKELSHNISPHILKNHGLLIAFKDFYSRMLFNGLKLNIVSNLDDVRIDPKYEINIYRIMTELITNTIKHADASEIMVQIKKKGNELKLDYSDNGKGFDVNKLLDENSGNGLYNIINRLQSMNSIYNFKSKPTKGFVFSAKLTL